MQRICIIGGGNMGMALAAIISQKDSVQVIVHTRKTNTWASRIYAEDTVTGERRWSGEILVTDSYEEAVKHADIVLITHPSFLIENTIKRILPYVQQSAWIGIVPGSGGAEYCAKELISKGNVLFGLDRVPCVARIKETGKSVYVSMKKQFRIAAIPQKCAFDVCRIMENLVGINCDPIRNYLSVTLTPSNPILHTSRLYSIYSEIDIDTYFEKPILFYGDWTDKASSVLMEADKELQKICQRFNELEVVPLTIHYESETVEKMTEKIRSIQSWNKIEMPMVCENGMYRVDRSSRYFCEDVPYGLCIIKAIGKLCDTKTPTIDAMLKWYESAMNVQYFIGDCFEGLDLKDTGIPQNFGINSFSMLKEYYGLH